jgi:DNA polymerase III epsilon subunit-like protein
MDGKRFRDTTFAVVDVETTGMDPRQDGVVEVACVLMRDGERLETFGTLVDPERPIPAVASAVHHLTDAHVRGAPRLEDVAGRLRAMTETAVVVAHNASFDLRFLTFLRDRPALCSMRFARMVLADAPNYQNQVLRYHLGIVDAALDAASAHRALGDAIVTSRAIEAMNRPRILAALPFGRHRGQPLSAVPLTTWSGCCETRTEPRKTSR